MDDILNHITTLTRNYAKTYRWNVNYEKYRHFEDLLWEKISFDTEWVRESLICHVGHLPIIASYLHQFCEHKEKIDLGRALMMLAIHDIGETIVWDVITVKNDRTLEQDFQEKEAVKSLLNDEQYLLYMEYETYDTYTWKFAKAIDKLAGTLMFYASKPEVEYARYAHFWFTMEDLHDRYIPYMYRDTFLTDFYELLMKRIIEQQTNVSKLLR